MSHKKEIVYSTDEEEEKPVQRIRKPLSEEAKQQLRDRLAKAREAKKAKRQTTPPAVHSEEQPVKRRGRTKKVVNDKGILPLKPDSRVGTDPTVEPKKRERKKKEVIIVEPESESDPDKGQSPLNPSRGNAPPPEPVVELTKKNIRKKKEVVIVEPESPPPEPDKGRSPLNPSQDAPLVEQIKPKRKYIRKPKITMPAFNPF